MSVDWSDERVERLKSLWLEGKSASQIAEILGGVTRNAVIGKAHRLGLDSRPSPIRRSATPRPEAPPRRRAEPQRAGATVLDLTERMCRWPHGHPGDASFHFCGKKTEPGMPYCAEHAAVAYQTPSSRRDSSTGEPRQRDRSASR